MRLQKQHTQKSIIKIESYPISKENKYRKLTVGEDFVPLNEIQECVGQQVHMLHTPGIEAVIAAHNQVTQ